MFQQERYIGDHEIKHLTVYIFIGIASSFVYCLSKIHKLNMFVKPMSHQYNTDTIYLANIGMVHFYLAIKYYELYNFKVTFFQSLDTCFCHYLRKHIFSFLTTFTKINQ